MPHLSTVNELLAELKISRTLLWRLRQSNDFPAPIRLGQRRIVFDKNSVNAWLMKRGAANDAGAS